MANVLIVEDDPIIVAKIIKTIKSIGTDFQIIETADGKKALEIALVIKIDIFIIDLFLENWDGYQLAKELRKYYKYNQFIMESGKETSEYWLDVHQQLGLITFLKKPYSIEQLKSRIISSMELNHYFGTGFFLIEQNGTYINFAIEEIVYIEKIKEKHSLLIAKYNRSKNQLEKEKFYLNINSLKSKLDSKEILQCHRSYMVNPKYIHRLDYRDMSIEMKYADKKIPIGKTYKNNLFEFVSLIQGGQVWN